MVVVDTNVVAYLLIKGDRTAEAQTLYARDPDWRSESFLLVEFSKLVTEDAKLRRAAPALTQTLAQSLG